MKISLKDILVVIVVFQPLFACATKISPVSLEELLNRSSVVSVVMITQASISKKSYSIVYSGEEKHFIDYSAVIVNSVKGGNSGSSIKFSSSEPLFVNHEYLVYLDSPSSKEFFVAQAGYAAFEKSFISFESGIKEGLRIPFSFISLPKSIPMILDVTKLNEQSLYAWVEWLPFRERQFKNENIATLDKER